MVSYVHASSRNNGAEVQRFVVVTNFFEELRGAVAELKAQIPCDLTTISGRSSP
jgi:hypothetical protein